jgi:hypothetical protein
MRDSLGVTGAQMVRSALAAMVIVSLPTPARSQALPSFVGQGFDQLIAGRPDSAVAIWAWAWNAPEDMAKKTQLVDAFHQLPGFAGKPLSYEPIRIVEITPHLRRAYFLLRCERQPVYVLMVLYQATDSWLITTVNWHTNADNVLPPMLFGAEHPKP